jgi:hypothetical protein
MTEAVSFLDTIQWVPRPGNEADLSIASNAEVKNGGAITSTPTSRAAFRCKDQNTHNYILPAVLYSPIAAMEQGAEGNILT